MCGTSPGQVWKRTQNSPPRFLFWNVLTWIANFCRENNMFSVLLMIFYIKNVLLMQRGDQISHKNCIIPREVWKMQVRFSPLSTSNASFMWNLIPTLHGKHILPPKHDPNYDSYAPKATLRGFWAVSWRFFALHLQNIRPCKFEYFLGQIGKMRLEPLSQITCALLKPLVHGLYAG